MKFIEKIKGSKAFKKTVAMIASASLAVSAMAVNVFAAESGGTSSGLDVSSITDSMQSSLTDLVTKAGIACAAVIGVGLSIFAGKWLVTTIKNFFTKVAK